MKSINNQLPGTNDNQEPQSTKHLNNCVQKCFKVNVTPHTSYLLLARQ